MKTFEMINKEIANWNGTFDKLVKHFTNDDYGVIFEEANWTYDSLGDCYEAAYEDGDWDECLYIYLGDLLKSCIEMGVRSGTDNLFRLWYERV